MKIGLSAIVLILASLMMATSKADSKDIEMQSVFPKSLPLVGDTAADMSARIALLTGGSLTISFRNPGELVAAGEVWDSVSTGAVDAGWTSPGFVDGVIPAAALFSAFS